MLEDYSLRYAPTTYRKWSSFAVANTALGGIAYQHLLDPEGVDLDRVYPQLADTLERGLSS